MSRKSAENIIISNIKKLSPKSDNYKLYTELFASMNDEQFNEFINDLESGKKTLSIIEPNGIDTGLSVENNLKIAEELGHQFFSHLWIEGKEGEIGYKTPIPYLVIDLPLRRASQVLIKKIKVPEHNRIVDTLTGQPTGDSKGAKISNPELQVCAAMGLEDSMVELMKYRGGDNKGNKAYDAMLSKLGRANINTLSQYSSGVESTKTLKTFITSMMLKTTL